MFCLVPISELPRIWPKTCQQMHEASRPTRGLTLSTHLIRVSRPLASLPKTSTLRSGHRRVAYPTVFWSVVLLAGAIAAQHSICVLDGMLVLFVVASVARVDLRAAGESEPSIRLLVMPTPASVREFGASNDTKVLLRLLAARSPRRSNSGCADKQELDFDDLDRHLLVTLTTDRDRVVASNGHDARGRKLRRALRASRREVAGQHVDDSAPVQIDITGSQRVGMDHVRTEADGHDTGTLLATDLSHLRVF